MTDQPDQQGDAAPQAAGQEVQSAEGVQSRGGVQSGEGVPSTGATTSAEDSTSTSTDESTSTPRSTSDQQSSPSAQGASGDSTTADPRPGQTADQRSSDGGDDRATLFAPQEGERLRGEWESVQAAFVDDPRAAVQRANALVSEVVQNLTESFTTAQSRLEQQWSQGEDVSTEDLRQALHRYRSFFERLLRL
jgi:hypothetical protein